MGTMWPKSGSYEFDSNGVAADGALAYFYAAGTSTPLTVYSDGAESTPHEDPVEAEGNGRWPLVFVPYVATYKFVLKTAAGTTLFTADNVPNPEPFDETFEVDEDAQLSTGDMWFTVMNGTRSGAVRCNARTIGDASSGATERANDDTSALFAFLWNNLTNGQAAVSGGRGASAPADFAAHKTITLPDLRSGGPIGVDDMGNTAAGRATLIPYYGGNSTTGGSACGDNGHVLTEAQLPGHTHAFSATSGTESADHTHSISITSGTESADHTHSGTTASGGGAHTHNMGTTVATTTTLDGTAYTALAAGAGVANTDNANTDHTHTFTTGGKSATHTHLVSGTSAGKSATHTHAVSGTSGSTGSGTTHNNVPYGVSGTWYMKL